MKTSLVVHHIGARGETQAFPALPEFDEDVINVLVDADKSSGAETRAHNSTRKAQIIIAPFCIAGSNGHRAFHHTNCPYGSSMLSVDPNIGDLYVAPRWIDFDYTLKDALKTIRTETLETVTIDAMVSGSNGRIPPPDFLSLDTQGSELEILTGAPMSVDSALAVVCEVEFVPLYEGQPLAGDVLNFMQAKGFVFCGFSEILHGSYHRAPVGLRGKTCPVTTDALFFKRPERVAESLRRKKLAFFALINGHLEFALWALSGLQDEPHQPAWLRFVDEFKAIADGFPKLLLENFNEQKSSPDPAAVRDRFAQRAAGDVDKMRAQSKLLSDLLTQHGLGKVAETQAAHVDWLLSHFHLQNGAP
jgi:FkbM family methyltransferase